MPRRNPVNVKPGAMKIIQFNNAFRFDAWDRECIADKTTSRWHFRTYLAPEPSHRHRGKIGVNHILIGQAARPEIAPLKRMFSSCRYFSEPTQDKRQGSNFQPGKIPVWMLRIEIAQHSAQARTQIQKSDSRSAVQQRCNRRPGHAAGQIERHLAAKHAPVDQK